MLGQLITFSNPITLTKRLFLLAVVAIAVAPRMPFDRPYTIGGDLSHRFRQLLIVIALINLFKHTIFSLGVLPQVDRLLIYALESILISFLSLLTPYLLRTWLSDRVNFPGARSPGRGLVPWVYATILLCLAGVFLKHAFDNDDLWIPKKIADVLTFIPVMRTLRIYNTVTTSETRYPGRGSVLSQTVMVIEYYCLLSQSGQILLKAASLVGLTELTVKGKFMTALNNHNHFAIYTRILGHAIFLNVLDEMHHFRDIVATSNTASDTETPPACDMNQSSGAVEVIPYNRSRK